MIHRNQFKKTIISYSENNLKRLYSKWKPKTIIIKYEIRYDIQNKYENGNIYVNT